MRLIRPLTLSVVAVLSVASPAVAATPVPRAATHVKRRAGATIPKLTGNRVLVSAPVRYIPFVDSLQSVMPRKGATRPSPPATAVIELLIGTGTAGMGLALPAILAGVVVLALALAVRRPASEPSSRP
jgi:hypothetical protein